MWSSNRLLLPLSRIRRWVALVIFILVIATILTRAVAFAHLFGLFGPHAGIRVTQQQIADAYDGSQSDASRTPAPRILHQIFQNWNDPGNPTLPAHWEAARKSCIDLNPDWEFKVVISQSAFNAPSRAMVAECICSLGTWHLLASS